ncbi:hypothetical protein [Stieleria varia]|uniref:Uncharacterized protein n=1 Tax=Stieleria varia TaxID=2528005 RepID=A0A5C6B2K3_9BACT|nr:hypothetical protein [Stieleria varia]TWU05761.1 hypothetical protein Pla52n_14760 [Stieleria varia]
MRRRKREQTITLFSFQDIITGVAGVMLFVLLLLVVQLTIRTAAAAAKQDDDAVVVPEPPVSETEIAEARYEELEQSLQEMKTQLDELRQQSEALLHAAESNLDDKIAQTQAEIDELIRLADEQKRQAEQLAADIAAQEVSEQRESILERRGELQKKLETLEAERQRHAKGKLVAFRTASNQNVPMWVVDLRDLHADLFDVTDPSTVTSLDFERKDPPGVVMTQVASKLKEKTKSRNIILLLRPSVAGAGVLYMEAFRAVGFNVALELLDEDTLVTEPSLP